MIMKTPMTLLTIGLLSLSLLGCATHGKVYDDSKVAMIKKDATTEAELLEWFGPATTRTMGPDGSKVLTWKFAPPKAGTSGSAGRLEVRFGPDGKVNSYNAMGGK
jgi:hypothetical protein